MLNVAHKPQGFLTMGLVISMKSLCMSFYSPMKPLDSPIPSGDREISRGLYAFFKQQGHRPFVISRLVSRRKKFQMRRLTILTWWFIWFPTFIKNLFKPADLLFTYHSYYKAPDWLHPFISLITGTPYVVFEASFKPSLKRSSPFYFYLLKFSFDRARLLFTDTKKDFFVLKEHFPDKTFYIKPSVQTQTIVDPRAVKQKSYPLKLISLAMLRKDRKLPSVLWLVETLAELQEEGYEFFYQHIGGGEGFEDLKRACEKYLEKSSYALVGTKSPEEAQELLAGSDIFVYPGIGEAFGMVYLEAQAKGLPVVAFANGGVADAVSDGYSGYLCAPMNRKEYKARIIEFMNDDEKYKKFSQQARQYVLENHNQNKNYVEMMNLIEQNAL